MHFRQSTAFWVIAYAAVFLAARGISAWDMADNIPSQGAWWLRGAASDIGAAALLALLAVASARLWRHLPYVWLLAIAFLLAGNREYISEWNSNLSLLDAVAMLEPEFVRGSVLTPRLGMTVLWLWLVGAVIAGVMRRYAANMALLGKWFWPPLLALPLCMLLPVSPFLGWVQQNVLEENARQLLYLATPQASVQSQTAIVAARRMLNVQRAQDLGGKLFVQPQQRANVLIIAVESLSEAALRNDSMPYLKKLADTHLHYPQFINPNITTARGLFALYCGEPTYFGRYGRDRLARRIAANHIDCLPKLLAAKGYQSVYLQAADLNFQDKRNTMPNMGFQAVYGNERFNSADWFSTWGPDDRALYKEAGRIIEEMEAKSPFPWLMGIMTVGTHHPYNVDPSFEPDMNLRKRAFRYADKAIEELVAWLEKTGRLQNTLVIITGDESRDTRKVRSRLASVITRNQGLLVMLTPHGETMRANDAFLQSDLPLSVLDYLGIEPPGTLGGRSLFRHYKKFRPIVFSDYGQNALYAVWRKKQLVHCHTGSWDCRRYRLGNRTLFEPKQTYRRFKRVPSGAMRALMELNAEAWKPLPKKKRKTKEK